jgi:hypothetical protein
MDHQRRDQPVGSVLAFDVGGANRADLARFAMAEDNDFAQ